MQSCLLILNREHGPILRKYCTVRLSIVPFILSSVDDVDVLLRYGRSLGSGPSCYLAQRLKAEGKPLGGLILQVDPLHTVDICPVARVLDHLASIAESLALSISSSLQLPFHSARGHVPQRGQVLRSSDLSSDSIVDLLCDAIVLDDVVYLAHNSCLVPYPTVPTTATVGSETCVVPCCSFTVLAMRSCPSGTGKICSWRRRESGERSLSGWRVRATTT